MVSAMVLSALSKVVNRGNVYMMCRPLAVCLNKTDKQASVWCTLINLFVDVDDLFQVDSCAT